MRFFEDSYKNKLMNRVHQAKVALEIAKMLPRTNRDGIHTHVLECNGNGCIQTLLRNVGRGEVDCRACKKEVWEGENICLFQTRRITKEHQVRFERFLALVEPVAVVYVPRIERLTEIDEADRDMLYKLFSRASSSEGRAPAF